MDISIVVAAYNMERELPRTIRSLSPLMQRDVGAGGYEIIIADNGSGQPVDLASYDYEGVDIRVLRIPCDQASSSPVQALNAGIRQARGQVVGVMIDGARMASPGLLAGALLAQRLDDRAVTVTLGFHLGPKPQAQSILEGYDKTEEDRLLDRVRWMEDGYRLFEISVFAISSSKGWFRPISETNALFMRRPLWDELGGYDERFATPGGGFANVDMLSRAVCLPNTKIVTLLGEGTFHQVHGGVSTNAIQSINPIFYHEYVRMHGKPFHPADYESIYLGRLPRGPFPLLLPAAN